MDGWYMERGCVDGQMGKVERYIYGRQSRDGGRSCQALK